jgi:tripartite-type tricarboxylate transporter receptor subunit TctC
MSARGWDLEWRKAPEFAKFLEADFNETGEVVKAVGLANKG